jgi:hypothetical protein
VFSEPRQGLPKKKPLWKAIYTEALSEAEDVGNVMQQNGYQNHQNGQGGQGGKIAALKCQASVSSLLKSGRRSEYEEFPKLITIEFMTGSRPGPRERRIIYIWTDGPMRAKGTTASSPLRTYRGWQPYEGTKTCRTSTE